VSGLVLHPNLSEVDDIYQALVDAHAGRTDAESMRLNARLVLLLANHIGDPAIVREAIAYAGSSPQEKA
jgi:hypothetical protein